MGLKILVTSDFHSSEELKDAAVKEIEDGEYDIFLNLGDYMDEEYAEDLLERVEENDVVALGCTGNRDMMFSEEFLDGEVPVFNFLEAEVDGEFMIILIGGNFPDDVKDEVTRIIEEHGDPSKVIVGSHYPPQKVGDRIDSGRRIGFEQFRELIIKHKPALWASGHVHEDFGEYSLLGTKILNAAADETGKAFAVEIGDEGGVEKVEEVVLVDS